MTAIDFAFLAVCLAALGAMIVSSKVLRAILWETLRHPFRSSRIEVHEGQIVVKRLESQPVNDDQPKSPAGAK